MRTPMVDLPLHTINCCSSLLFRYARCYSGYQKTKNHKPADESLFTKLLKFAPFYQKPPPRVQMFGPGLEASTSGLVHKLLWNEISPFRVQNMFSGLEDGR